MFVRRDSGRWSPAPERRTQLSHDLDGHVTVRFHVADEVQQRWTTIAGPHATDDPRYHTNIASGEHSNRDTTEDRAKEKRATAPVAILLGLFEFGEATLREVGVLVGDGNQVAQAAVADVDRVPLPAGRFVGPECPLGECNLLADGVLQG